MCVQLLHTFHHKLDIAMQQSERLANGPRLFAHARVFQNGAHRIEGGHAGGRGYDPDTRIEPLAYNFREICVKFSIDGF